MFSASRSRSTAATSDLTPKSAAAGSGELDSESCGYEFLRNIETTAGRRPREIRISPREFSVMAGMERQYWEIKSKFFDVVIFFKKGKFYELYDCDAVLANKEFGLKMANDTSNRGKMRMAGVPEQTFSEWARLFVFRGYKVGRVEQLTPSSGSPVSGTKVLPRALVQIMTRGTVTDCVMISGSEAQFVLVLCPLPLKNSAFFIDAVALDISRSELLLCPCQADDDASSNVNAKEISVGMHFSERLCESEEEVFSRLSTLLLHLQPKEIVIPSANLITSLLGSLPGCYESLVNLLEGSSSSPSIEYIDESDFLKSNPANAMSILRSYCAYLRLPIQLPSFDGSSSESALRVSNYTHHCKAEVFVVPEKMMSLLERERRDPGLALDAAACENLELVSSLQTVKSESTAFGILCCALTPGGKRLFRSWLLRPLTDSVIIEARQQCVQSVFHADTGETMKFFSTFLKAKTASRSLSVIDVERDIARLSEIKLSNPNVQYADPLVMYSKNLDLLLRIIAAFEQTVELSKALKARHPNVPPLFEELLAGMSQCEASVNEVLGLFDRVEAEKSSRIIPTRGTYQLYDQAVDSLRQLESEFASDLAKYRAEVFHGVSISWCDIGNDLFLIEAPASACGKVSLPSDFVERSRSGKSIKYGVGCLAGRIEEYRQATAARDAALVHVLRQLAACFCERIPQFYAAYTSLAYVDALYSLASFAHGTPMFCPTIRNSNSSAIRACNVIHPFFLGSNGIPNSLSLGGCGGRVLVLTGPNMGGKSTLMRTVALAVIMAQMGGFVCASSFDFTPIRRIFTRIGARDATHRGHSTLFVELSEMSEALRQSDTFSLCLIDELGRGTSTHDGLAIAAATLESLVNSSDGPLVIFSTHHTSVFAGVGTKLQLQHGFMDYKLEGSHFDSEDEPMRKRHRVDDLCEQVCFLYTLVPGVCKRSFAFEVALRAGINRHIVGLAVENSRRVFTIAENLQHLQKLKKVVFDDYK